MIQVKKSCKKIHPLIPVSTRLPRPSISPLRFRHVQESNFLEDHSFNIHEVVESNKDRHVEDVSKTFDIGLKL
jgi:hypothetical protein